MPGVNIQAPNLRAPRVSILSSADVITVSGDNWWSKIEVYPLGANDSSAIYPICPVGTVVKEEQNHIDLQQFYPFAIYATDNCGTFGSGGIDFVDRAKQKLAVAVPYWLEKEIYSGADTSNPNFEGSSVTSLGTGQSPRVGFASIDAAVASSRVDGRGMIHVPVGLFDFIVAEQVLTREGNIWISPLDNIVVPGRGYGDDDGEGPIYGHPGIIQIVMSEVFDYGGDIVNWRTNDIWVTAERVVGYIFPNGVGTDDNYLFTVELDTALADGGGAGGGGGEDVNEEPVVITHGLAADDTAITATAYAGYSVKNNSNAVSATVVIHAGSDNTGAILDIIELAPGESNSEWYYPGIATNGVFVDITAGALTSTSRIRVR